jgi:hypothetical protein
LLPLVQVSAIAPSRNVARLNPMSTSSWGGSLLALLAIDIRDLLGVAAETEGVGVVGALGIRQAQLRGFASDVGVAGET